MSLVAQTGQLLSQSAELLKNPIVLPALKGVFGVLKGAFGSNKRAQQRLEMLEKMDANELAAEENKKLIDALKVSLDDALFENAELEKKLAEVITQVEEKMKEAGVGTTTETTTINTNINASGDNNKIVAGIKNVDGDITFN